MDGLGAPRRGTSVLSVLVVLAAILFVGVVAADGTGCSYAWCHGRRRQP